MTVGERFPGLRQATACAFGRVSDQQRGQSSLRVASVAAEARSPSGGERTAERRASAVAFGRRAERSGRGLARSPRDSEEDVTYCAPTADSQRERARTSRMSRMSSDARRRSSDQHRRPSGGHTSSVGRRSSAVTSVTANAAASGGHSQPLTSVGGSGNGRSGFGRYGRHAGKSTRHFGGANRVPGVPHQPSGRGGAKRN